MEEEVKVNLEDEDELEQYIGDLYQRANDIVEAMSEKKRQLSEGNTAISGMQIADQKARLEEEKVLLGLVSDLCQMNIDIYTRLEGKLSGLETSISNLGDEVQILSEEDDEELMMEVLSVKSKIEGLERELKEIRESNEISNNHHDVMNAIKKVSSSINTIKAIVIAALLISAVSGAYSIFSLVLLFMK